MFNKLMWKRPKDQSGMALPMALILMAVASLIVVPGLWATGNMFKINQTLESSTMAYYAAKSGIEDAYWRFRNSAVTPTVLGTYSLTSPVNGMTVTITDTPDPLHNTIHTVKSEGIDSSGKTLSTIYASMTVEIDSGYPFQYALATTNGDIYMEGTAKVESLPKPPNYQADVYAIGNIDVSNVSTGGHIYGNASATQRIIDNECNPCNTALGYDHDKITGTSISYSTENVTFQPLNRQYYWDKTSAINQLPATGWSGAVPPATAYSGTTLYTISGGTSANPKYLGGAGNTSRINGNLYLNGYVRLKGTVWVTGWIKTAGTTCKLKTDPAYPGDQYYLVAQGVITHADNLREVCILLADEGYSIVMEGGTYIDAYGSDGTGNLNCIADTNTPGTGGIYYKGAINTNNASGARVGINFAPNGTVFLDAAGGAEIGPVIGNNIILHSNVIVNYNTAFRQNDTLGYKINAVSVSMAEYSAQ